jgi:hypothetical protein
MVRSYSRALFVVKSSNEAAVENLLDLAIIVNTKEESIIADTTAIAILAIRNFVFKVSSESEGNPKTVESVNFLTIE